MQIQQNISLASYTSWLVGGAAQYFALPTNLEELKEAQKFAQDKKLPITILGDGSNVLISDQGIEGLTICLRKLSGTEVREESGRLYISVWAGTGKSELLKIFLKYKLAPALFLAGIPGDVGGGVVMNAGVAESFTPREFYEFVEEIEVLKPDGTVVKYSSSQLQWDYRHSDGWQPGIITKALISWPLEPDPTILEQVKQANKVRLSKQPLDMPSCGSVFRNPLGHKAAQLIDSCGLKGFRIGDAQVSTKHANFIVNLDKAQATDIWSVIEHVKATVRKEKNVELQTEVVRLGEW